MEEGKNEVTKNGHVHYSNNLQSVEAFDVSHILAFLIRKRTISFMQGDSKCCYVHVVNCIMYWLLDHHVFINSYVKGLIHFTACSAFLITSDFERFEGLLTLSLSSCKRDESDCYLSFKLQTNVFPLSQICQIILDPLSSVLPSWLFRPIMIFSTNLILSGWQNVPKGWKAEYRQFWSVLSANIKKFCNFSRCYRQAPSFGQALLRSDNSNPVIN